MSKGGVFGLLGVFGSDSGRDGGSRDDRNDDVGYDGCRNGEVGYDGELRGFRGFSMTETGL